MAHPSHWLHGGHCHAASTIFLFWLRLSHKLHSTALTPGDLPEHEGVCPFHRVAHQIPNCWRQLVRKALTLFLPWKAWPWLEQRERKKIEVETSSEKCGRIPGEYRMPSNKKETASYNLALPPCRRKVSPEGSGMSPILYKRRKLPKEGKKWSCFK